MKLGGALTKSGKGLGVAKDLTEAKKWYEKAAAQGNETAKKNLKRLNGN